MERSLDNKIPEAFPAAVRAWLSQALQALIDSLGEELEALILFGSAAEGLMRASSDVNLLVVLRRFDSDRIDRASAVHRSVGPRAHSLARARTNFIAGPHP